LVLDAISGSQHVRGCHLGGSTWGFFHGILPKNHHPEMTRVKPIRISCPFCEVGLPPVLHLFLVIFCETIQLLGGSVALNASPGVLPRYHEKNIGENVVNTKLCLNDHDTL